MSISIVSEGPCEYRNYNTPRFENHYGYAQLMSGAFVIKTIKIAYLNQEILHFQQSSTDILQSIGCGVKKILNSLTPPVSADVTVYLLRQKYTSVRFKLRPGVLANININWHFPEQLCDETLQGPPSAQGNPSAPTNGSYTPGSRPPDQVGDPRDNSPNDGQTPTGDQTAPPGPSNIGSNGTWKVQLSAYDGSNHPYTVQFDLGITDPNAVVTVSTRNGPGGTNSAGLQDKVLQVTVNGVTSDTRASGFGMNVFNPYYSN